MRRLRLAGLVASAAAGAGLVGDRAPVRRLHALTVSRAAGHGARRPLPVRPRCLHLVFPVRGTELDAVAGAIVATGRNAVEHLARWAYEGALVARLRIAAKQRNDWRGELRARVLPVHLRNAS